MFLDVGSIPDAESSKGNPNARDLARLLGEAGQLAARQKLLVQRARERKAAAIAEHAGYRDEEMHAVDAPDAESESPQSG